MTTRQRQVSDPDLLKAFRGQCRAFGPGMALLAWQGQAGVQADDLLDIAKEEDRRRVAEDHGEDDQATS